MSRASSGTPLPTIEPLEFRPHFPDSQIACFHDPLPGENKKENLRELSKALVSSPGAMPAATTTRGWTPEGLVALGPRMQHVPRVSVINDSEHLHAIIREHEASGVPLIVEDWEKTPQWPGDKLFSVDWLLEHGDEMIAVRDCVTLRDKEILFKEFIEKSRTISEYAEEDEDERLYGKDAVCPKGWQEWLRQSPLPDFLKPDGPEDVLDLLPEPERVETLMCYYGVGDTFTAAHKDLCASYGHNLMCSVERGGSAFWFMTRSSDAARAASYFHKLGVELDHETRIVTPEEFAKAPFTVYVCEQRVGDLVLVPRRSCHQVVNHGGITAKMSWSRMSVEGLCTAFHHELPVYRRVCRSETYRVKLLVYRALLKYTEELRREQEQTAVNVSSDGSHVTTHNERASSVASEESSLTSLASASSETDKETDPLQHLTPRHKRLVEDARTLLGIYDKILKEEHQGDYQCEMRIRRSSPGLAYNEPSQEPTDVGLPSIPAPELLYHDGLTCDFCGADIFQSFFECRRCTNGEDNVVVCPGCYVEGRACVCEIMTPKQQFPMDMLFEVQNQAQEVLSFGLYGERGNHAHAKLSHQTVEESVDHPGIFSAACQLLQFRISNRMAKQRNYICRNKKRETHPITASGALQCKKCHSARCFRHILKDGLHAADAIKLQLSDATHETWHTNHINTIKTWVPMTLDVLRAEENGSHCDMRVGLALHAEKFRSCRPMTCKVKPGWYDNAFAFEPVRATDSQSSVEGFTGAVLDEEDSEVVEDDTTDASSSDGSVYGKPTRKKSGIKIRLNMKRLQPPRRTAPRSEAYILLDRLTEGQREKFIWHGPEDFDEASHTPSESPPHSSVVSTPEPGPSRDVRSNMVVVRRHRTARKKPPGIRETEQPPQGPIGTGTSEDLTFNDEQIVVSRKPPPPRTDSRPAPEQTCGTGPKREISNPKRYHAKGRTEEPARSTQAPTPPRTLSRAKRCHDDHAAGDGSIVVSTDLPRKKAPRIVA